MNYDEEFSEDDCDPHYRLQFALGCHENAISCVKFSPSGQSIASSSYTNDIKIWKSWATDEMSEQKLLGHKAGVSEVDWSKDGDRLVSASDDKRLKIWNVNTGECVKTLRGHENYVFCTKFSEDSRLILSGSDDLTVRIWDTNSGKCATIKPHSDRVTSVDFDRETKHFLSSSYDGYCYMSDLRTKTKVQEIYCKNKAISFAKFSPNGNYILFSTLDSNVKLWDKRNQKCTRIYEGHKNEIYSIIPTFSLTSQKKYIVSGSEDNLIYIWDLNSKELVERLYGHTACVICVDCHPTQDVIVSGALDEDNSIKIWRKW